MFYLYQCVMTQWHIRKIQGEMRVLGSVNDDTRADKIRNEDYTVKSEYSTFSD